LIPFTEELHDDELAEGYFQQDGARVHTTVANMNFLREFYDERLISINAAIRWPPRSCDLTPCDFFLWPHLKNSIFRQPVDNLDQLQERIAEKIREINNNPVILNNVIEGFKRRIRLCINEDGHHVSHLT
jgi:hypothetical protein